MKVTIPNGWDKIKIDQFPLLYDIINDDNIEPIDKEVRIISILTGLQVSTIERIELSQLKDLIKRVRFIFAMDFPKPVEEFKHGGYTWKVNYDARKITASDFITLSKLTESEDVIMQNMAEITSVFVKPYRRKWFKLVPVELEYEERLRLIREVNVGVIYPVCVFFCKVLTNLLPIIKGYLENEKQKILEKIVKDLKN